MIGRVRGTRDLLDVNLFMFTIGQMGKHVERYGYAPIITPIIEPVELFQRSLGEQTDVVSKEMFVVTSSSGKGDETICLRPEATASTIRAFVQEGIAQVPWKVYTYGPMFRYERPQKGRYRQFYQFNIECIGSNSVAEDAHFIAMMDRLFGQTLQLENYALQINYLGTPQEREAFKKVLVAFLEKHPTICDTCKKRMTSNTLRVFDCKNADCQKIYQDAPTLIDSFKKESQEEWQQLQNYLEELSVSFVVNTRLVRGLDYYNKTVFEFVSSDLGAQDTFCAGGRYDHLVSQIGGKTDQPSIGSATGLDRLVLLLEKVQNKLSLPQEQPLHIILPLSQEQQGLALQLAAELLNADLTTQVLFEGSVKSMMKKANKCGASYVLLLGQQEQEDGTVTLKEMTTGKEHTIKQTEAVSFLKK